MDNLHDDGGMSQTFMDREEIGSRSCFCCCCGGGVLPGVNTHEEVKLGC